MPCSTRAVATLPALTPVGELPITDLPYEQTMADAFAGTGWHRARAHGRRWVAPVERAQTTSTVRLPVRLAGSARLELSVVSAADRAVVGGLELRVQHRPAAHRIADDGAGVVVVVADVDLVDDQPVVIELRVPHARPLSDGSTGRIGPEAALALGTIRLTRLT